MNVGQSQDNYPFKVQIASCIDEIKSLLIATHDKFNVAFTCTGVDWVGCWTDLIRSSVDTQFPLSRACIRAYRIRTEYDRRVQRLVELNGIDAVPEATLIQKGGPAVHAGLLIITDMCSAPYFKVAMGTIGSEQVWGNVFPNIVMILKRELNI